MDKLLNLSSDNYPYKPWSKVFPDKVDITKLPFDSSYKKFFEENKEIVKAINEKLTSELNKTIFPYPEGLFNFLSCTPLDKIQVVIIGQDPYHSLEIIPDAMGLCFSVPNNVAIPSSLKNIFKNLQEFGHIKDIPEHGNLTKWALQGCLMMNSALTVIGNNPNSHQSIWKDFTNNLIKFISDNTHDVVFLLWGNNALQKMFSIDEDKHYFSVSSHPSGLSVNKPLGVYKPFKKVDHFGFVNKKIKIPIDWSL